MTRIIKRKGNKVLIKAGPDCNAMKAATLLSVKNTGNGYVAKFPAHLSIEQDYYICLDYHQAALLLEGLKAQIETGESND